MKLAYDATLDEMAQTHLLLYRRTGQSVKWRWGGAVVTGALSGGVVALLVSGPIGARAAWAAPVAVLAGVFFFVTHPRTFRKAVRRLLRKQLGTDGPIRFEIELTDTGIRTRQRGTEITFDWSNVESVEDTPDVVTIYMADGGLVTVRARAFPSPDVRQEFLQIVRLRASVGEPEGSARS